MSVDAHAEAVLSALTGAGVAAYEPSDAPGPADPPHVVVTADMGRGESYRLNGRSKVTAYRVLLRAIGSTEHNARLIADDTIAALVGSRLTVAGSLCTPTRIESTQTVELDDNDVPGVYSGLIVVTFASTPTA